MRAYAIAAALLLVSSLALAAAGQVEVTDQKVIPPSQATDASAASTNSFGSVNAPSLVPRPDPLSFPNVNPQPAEADATGTLKTIYDTKCYQTSQDKESGISIPCGNFIRQFVQSRPNFCKAEPKRIVPEFLAECTIRFESSYIANARSGVGAAGLMQLMPGTWTELRARLLNAISDPLDSEDNIKAGMTYQRKIMQIKGCNLEGVIRGYHAGPYATHFGPLNDDYYQKVSSCYNDWAKQLKA